MPLSPDELNQRMQAIRLVAFDVDGVLTDGRLLLSSSGEETKCFHIQDGLGIVLAQKAGLMIALVSGRQSAAVDKRAAELGIPGDRVIASARDKRNAMRELKRQFDLPMEAVAFVGDDLNDLPAFGEVGLAVAVANGAEELRERAHFVTERAGGSGAAREILRRILLAQKKWDVGVAAYVDYLQNEGSGAAQ